MSLFAIYARAANGMIGSDGALPWHLPADLKRFKALTIGKPMIMGRKTFASFPRPLPGRRHVVLTRDRAWRAEGAEVVHSTEEALELAGPGEVALIGGAEVFRLMLPLCDRAQVTEVHADFAGDTLMPGLGPEWREVGREEHPAEENRPAFAFVTFDRFGDKTR